MSFTADVKEEIYQSRPSRGAAYRAFCYGLLLHGRNFLPDSVSLATEHLVVSKSYAFAIKDAIGIRPTVSEQTAPRRAKLYLVELEDPSAIARLFLTLSHTPEEINRTLIEGEFFSAFLAGAFLSCGSITEPKKGYHLELLPPTEELADLLFEELSRLGYPMKSTLRRGQTVLYCKESTQIEDFLTMMGAQRCSLSLMELKIYKDLRNRANRATNCETANIDKLVKAAGQQLADIALLRQKSILETLPAAVQQVASLREQYPEASLSELAAVSGISRSGIHHKLAKLGSLAASVRPEEVRHEG